VIIYCNLNATLPQSKVPGNKEYSLFQGALIENCTLACTIKTLKRLEGKMKKHLKIAAFMFVIITLLIAQGFGAESQAALFKITLINHSSNVLTPVPFITHNSAFDLFNEGVAASPEVEALAENGVFSGVVDLAASSGDVLDYQVAFYNSGPLLPGKSATVTIEADELHSNMSYMSMLAVSNDAFIGGAAGDGAISLYSNGTPSSGNYLIMSQNVWDAGTEVNDELAANVPGLGGAGSIDENGVIFLPHAGIQGIGDIGPEYNWLGGNVAEVSVEVVPIPGAVWLLGSALVVFLGIRRIT